MKFAEYKSPCGPLLLGVHGKSICLCDWMKDDRVEKSIERIKRHLPENLCEDDESLIERAVCLLDRYFSGYSGSFGLPLAFYGTIFQQQVWKALLRVPYGETTSYRIMAEAVGKSGGVRAVASAIAANPISIIVPCHRIIGSDGSLSGYAGGIEAKRFLLQLEAARKKV